MKITTEIILSDEDTKELVRIMNSTPDQLPQLLSLYSRVGLTELINLFLGKKVFQRGSDFLEYRLFLLIDEVFHEIPDEQLVSHLFQTTTLESRSLIRSVMSKYQYQLRTAIEITLSCLVRSAKQSGEGNPYIIIVKCQNLVDELNRILASIDGNLPPIMKERGSVSTYRVQPSSYQALISYLPTDESSGRN